MEKKFHCDVDHHFKRKTEQIRAFLFTDYSIEAHSHSFYEVNIILAGTGTHRIENTEITVKTGDVFVIPPNTVHAYYNTNSLNVYHILLLENFITDNRDESSLVPGFLQLVEIEPFLRQHSSNDMFLHLNHSQLIQLKSDLYFIEDNSLYDTDEYLPLQKCTAWKILYWLSSLLFKQMFDKNKKTTHKYELEIIKTLEYIHQNYGNKITVDMLCQKTYLSRSTFLRSFQTLCGCTPTEYITRYRCSKVAELSKNSGHSRTDIAHICGFYDLSHMEKMLLKNREIVSYKN